MRFSKFALFFSFAPMGAAFCAPASAATFQFTLQSREFHEKFDQGWVRISFPVQPDAGQSLPGGLFAFRDGAHEQIQLTDVEPGKGYYYHPVDENETLVIEGTPVQPDSESGAYEAAFDAGWALLGNPFGYHVEWSNLLVDGESILQSSALDSFDVPLDMRADKGEDESQWRFKPLKVLNYYTYLVEQPWRMGAWEAHWVRFNRPATVTWKAFTGDTSLEALEAKYQTYKEEYAARHRYLGGGTTEAYLDPTRTYVVRYGGQGDSIGFTGVTLAAFLWKGDWDMARAALRYIADCEDPADPGHLFRHPDRLALPDDNVTSRDQYTMVTLGLTVALVLNGVPEDIYNEAKRLARNIINRGAEKDWDISPGPSGANSIKSMIYIYEKWASLLGQPAVYGDTPEESWERVKQGNFYPYSNAYFQYYANHLNICRFISMAMLAPDNPELPDEYSDFYLSIKNDQNTFGDILYHWIRGDPLDFAQVELAKFPEHLANTWEPNYFTHTDYRWQRNPASIEEDILSVPNNNNREVSGADYLVGYAFLRYAMDTPSPF